MGGAKKGRNFGDIWALFEPKELSEELLLYASGDRLSVLALQVVAVCVRFVTAMYRCDVCQAAMQQHVSRLCPQELILSGDQTGGDAYYIEPSITANIIDPASDVIIPPDKDVTLPAPPGHGTIDLATAGATKPQPDVILPSPVVLPDSAVHVTADGDMAKPHRTRRSML